MRVLIACERSGVIRDRLLAVGIDAVSCDLADTEKPGPHIKGDVLKVLSQGWDAMIAHPECTYLTNAGAWAFMDPPYHQQVKPGTLVGQARRDAREQALKFVTALWEAPIEKVCIENPQGCINTRLSFMPRPQVVQPHEFGDNASKATCLWMRGLKPLKPTQKIEGRLVYGGEQDLFGERPVAMRYENQTDSGQNAETPSAARWMDRSRTYPGIGDAMVQQWFLPLIKNE